MELFFLSNATWNLTWSGGAQLTTERARSAPTWLQPQWSPSLNSLINYCQEVTATLWYNWWLNLTRVCTNVGGKEALRTWYTAALWTLSLHFLSPIWRLIWVEEIQHDSHECPSWPSAWGECDCQLYQRAGLSKGVWSWRCCDWRTWARIR